MLGSDYKDSQNTVIDLTMEQKTLATTTSTGEIINLDSGNSHSRIRHTSPTLIFEVAAKGNLIWQFFHKPSDNSFTGFLPCLICASPTKFNRSTSTSQRSHVTKSHKNIWQTLLALRCGTDSISNTELPKSDIRNFFNAPRILDQEVAYEKFLDWMVADDQSFTVRIVLVICIISLTISTIAIRKSIFCRLHVHRST